MDPFLKYQTANASTAQPARQLLFVFDELLKLLFLAQKAIGERDYETKFKSLSKVEDVIIMLRSGIDMGKDQENVLKSLDAFYESIHLSVSNAQIKAEEPEDLADIIEGMKIVRDSLKTELEEEKKALSISGNSKMPPKEL